MSNVLKTDDAADKWLCIIFCIVVMLAGAFFTLYAMQKADERVHCYQRGGVMVKVEGERFCDLRGDFDGR